MVRGEGRESTGGYSDFVDPVELRDPDRALLAGWTFKRIPHGIVPPSPMIAYLLRRCYRRRRLTA